VSRLSNSLITDVFSFISALYQQFRTLAVERHIFRGLQHCYTPPSRFWLENCIHRTRCRCSGCHQPSSAVTLDRDHGPLTASHCAGSGPRDRRWVQRRWGRWHLFPPDELWGNHLGAGVRARTWSDVPSGPSVLCPLPEDGGECTYRVRGNDASEYTSGTTEDYKLCRDLSLSSTSNNMASYIKNETQLSKVRLIILLAQKVVHLWTLCTTASNVWSNPESAPSGQF